MKGYEIYVNDERGLFEIRRLKDWSLVDTFLTHEKAQNRLEELNQTVRVCANCGKKDILYKVTDSELTECWLCSECYDFRQVLQK